MASYSTVWTLFGILLVQQYAFAKDTDKANAMVSSVDDEAVDQRADNFEHNLRKRYINGLTGDDDMAMQAFSNGFGYDDDSYPDFPDKRHASRWALIHRKLAERENSKRYNYFPMESDDVNADKRSPSRWRLIHNKLKQLQKREARYKFGGLAN